MLIGSAKGPCRGIGKAQISAVFTLVQFASPAPTTSATPLMSIFVMSRACSIGSRGRNVNRIPKIHSKMMFQNWRTIVLR